jgi:NADH-quinone oxidoreductase subunit C
LIARPASWAERELHDFFAVAFPGHPNLAPLLRPSQLTDGFFRDAATAE